MTKRATRSSFLFLILGAAVALGGLAARAQGRKAGDGVYSAEQADRGAEAYEKACASCHMADLRGEGFAPALNGDAFALRWETGKLGDLFKIVKGTMPADNPDSLTAGQYADIVAFMLKANGYPAGQALSENPNDSAQVGFGK